tara:strand:- start:413 stop:1591 length:1179 start_codon:yes stop_codon:yes gene_type:complete
MTIMTLPQPRLSGLFEPRTIVSQPTPQTDISNNFGVQLPDPYNEILSIRLLMDYWKRGNDNKMYVICTDVQRDPTTWSNEYKASYIESLKNNSAPIPMIINEIETGIHREVLDGGHRMDAIKSFLGMNGPENMFAVHGKKFSDYDFKEQKEFEMINFPIQKYKGLSDEQRVYLFNQINKQLDMSAGEILNSKSNTSVLCRLAKDIANDEQVLRRLNDQKFKPGKDKGERHVYIVLTMMMILNFYEDFNVTKNGEERLEYTEKPNPNKITGIIEDYEDEKFIKYVESEKNTILRDVRFCLTLLSWIDKVGTRELFVVQYLFMESKKLPQHIGRVRCQDIIRFGREVLSEKNSNKAVSKKYFDRIGRSGNNTGSPRNVSIKARLFHEMLNNKEF